MARSMTGYGRGQQTGGGCAVTVELRSVNHRYLDVSVRAPRAYLYMEELIKAAVGKAVSRGKVDVFVTIEPESGEIPVVVRINHAAATAYRKALNELQNVYILPGGAELMAFARLPEVLTVDKAEPDEDFLTETVMLALSDALAEYLTMSATEGENLKIDILSRAKYIEAAAARIDARSESTVKAYTERLATRLRETLERLGGSVDDARVLTEAAIFADRTATSEETVRLRSHIAQLREMLNDDTPVGRKLDFLIQEFNREINTIGSKASDLETTREVVDVKSEIEKIREQVQNIE